MGEVNGESIFGRSGQHVAYGPRRTHPNATRRPTNPRIGPAASIVAVFVTSLRVNGWRQKGLLGAISHALTMRTFAVPPCENSETPTLSGRLG